MKPRHFVQLTIALALALALERLLLGGASHGTFWWAHIPGFFALFGFFVCLLLAFLSKALSQYWLQRDEGYYRRGRPGDE